MCTNAVCGGVGRMLSISIIYHQFICTHLIYCYFEMVGSPDPETIPLTHYYHDQHNNRKEKADDPENQLFVFFPEDEKVGVKPIKILTDRMKDEQVSNAILVLRGDITPFAKQAVLEMSDSFRIEHFKEAELLVDITEHTLVPEHRVLSQNEKQELLNRYRLRETQLPRIQPNDPVARYYGMRRGQVVKIIRPSETAGRYVTYRICM